MPYRCDLGNGQQIYLDNQGSQTIVTVASSSAGQQQQSSSSVQTGPWTEAPQVAQMGNGAVIRCVSAQGVFTIQVQGNQIGQMAGSVDWQAAQTKTVHSVDHMPGSTMPFMQPMQPMQSQPMQPMQPHATDAADADGQYGNVQRPHGDADGQYGNAHGECCRIVVADPPVLYAMRCGHRRE
jgi:hypothetical protein